MYHVYTIKNRSEITKSLVGDFKDYDEAMDAAENAIEGKEGLDFIVEETDGHFNSYGDLTAEVIATSW